ncbi:MAG TPA: ABC transporter permease [Phycisphaerales bacterium]|nr:ABC transporter permease [Phycisphaerales bacterium]HRQ76712.1 ABC transporter permease [Phycisphaerales bacterium]
MRHLPLDYAVRNLGRSKARLVMIVCGSALLVLIILAAAAFVRGMNQSLRATGGEHNIILLGAGSEESVERSEVDMGVAGIAAASIHGIREFGGVPFVSPEIHAMLPVRTPRHTPDDPGTLATIRGVTPAALLVHEEVAILEGRYPETGRDEVLVGSTAATRLGIPDALLVLGRQVEIEGRPWTIVGRFTAGGTMAESEIWTGLNDLMEVTRRDSISCVVITLDPGLAEFEDVAVFAMMRPDLELVAMRETEYYGALASFFAPIRMVVWITAGLIALGGFLGGLNTMYAAFVSRVREFGALQAIGFRRRAIALSLVQESTVATAAGTLLACAIGVLLLDGLAVRFSMGAFGLIVDTSVLMLSLGVGLALGAFGALPPAYRCLRLSIPTALKAI